jgi:glutamyl-tRNA synthetase
MLVMTNSSVEKKVRVRFAPSPTGNLHIGGLRTALFNWLFARHHQGNFLVRIEDTDLERSTPEFFDSIIHALDWASITSDEPLVIQSQSLALHKHLIKKLLDEGKAYRCYCPVSTDVESMDYFRYGSLCRMKKPVELDQPYVVRIKLPEQERIEFNDLIYGPISFPLSQFDDFIIARSDGTPIYNFVVVADDAAMNITHVIRGEEHLQNTPKQIVLYNALGYTLPTFAHLPLILGPSGAKLSKRDGATSVLDYKKNGYLASALCNYLVRLGWSHGDQELFTLDELITHFSLAGVNKKGSIFDHKKLDWMNGIYIRQTPNQALIDLIQRDVDHNFCSYFKRWNHEQLNGFIALYKERSATLLELRNALYALYDSAHEPSAADIAQWMTADTAQYLNKFIKTIQESDEYSVEFIKKSIQTLCHDAHIKLVSLAQPLRLALTSTTASPSVFELMYLLGKEESLRRIKLFMSRLA